MIPVKKYATGAEKTGIRRIPAGIGNLAWTHTSQREDECCDVLERYVYHHPVTNKVLQILPD